MIPELSSHPGAAGELAQDVPVANTGSLAAVGTEVEASSSEAGSPPSVASESAVSGTADTALPPDEGALIDSLKQVFDPELMVNIVDLGLVYNVRQEADQVFVEMTLTSPACPAGPQIIQQSKQALERVPGVKEAQIKLVMAPPWTPDRMTDEARDVLGIF